MEDLQVPDCSALVLPRSNTFNLSWTAANFASDTATIGDTKYMIEWFYSDNRECDTCFEIVSASNVPLLRDIQASDIGNVSVLQMYCSWNSYASYGPRTNCTLGTYEPTREPTPQPTVHPTPAPSAAPTVIPSPQPTADPTSAPTFVFDEMMWCHAVFKVQSDTGVVTLTWDLVAVQEDAGDLSVPPKQWVRYWAEIGTTDQVDVPHADGYIQCDEVNVTQCFGYYPTSLTESAGGGYDVSNVTFYAEYTVGMICEPLSIFLCFKMLEMSALIWRVTPLF